MLEDGQQRIVIDTGPDFRQQMLRESVKSLDAVVFTHHHKDHIAGMDDVRAFNFRQRRPMDVYANDDTIAALKREYVYIFNGENYPGIPQVNLTRIDEQPFKVMNWDLMPIPVLHYKLPVLGFRVGDLAYITDANYIPPESMERLKGVRYLVLNALRREKHISHFTLSEAIEMVEKIGPEKAWFTHISHLLGKHEEVSRELPENVELAYDGLQIEY